MQLNETTDYAIKALINLGMEEEINSSRDVARFCDSTDKNIFKIMRKLDKAGFVIAYRGVAGGYKLAKDTRQITLWDIIRTMEPTVEVSKSLSQESNWPKEKSLASLRVIHFLMQEKLELHYSNYTIQDVIEFWSQPDFP